RGQVDRPVGVVAYVGGIDESTAAGEDEAVALLAHELALTPERHHGAVVVVASDVLDRLEIGDAVAEDRQEAVTESEVEAEVAAGPQVMRLGGGRDSGGAQALVKGSGGTPRGADRG